MDITLQLLYVLFRGILVLSPTLLFLITLMIAIGLFIGRLEKLSVLDAMYFTFITATTVGYGDFRPRRPASKIGAIFIALIGLVFTGIIVAISIHALEYALYINRARLPNR